MYFKTLLQVAFATALSVTVVAVSAKTVHVSYNVAEGASWDQGAKVFKKLVEERSDGKYKVSLHPNAAMAGGNDRVELEMVQGGAIQFVIKSNVWLTSLDPKFQVVSLPWLFPDDQTAIKVLDSAAGTELLDVLDSKDLKGLAWGASGFRQITNSHGPVTEPAHLKDLKIRVPGIPMYLSLYKALGANPTTISFSEVFTALQTGAVDGQESPLSLIWSSRFYEAQRYLTRWNYSYDAIAFAASSRFWQTLAPADQELFSTAAKDAMAREREIVLKEDNELLEKLKSAGMEIIELTPDQLAVFQKAVQPTYEEYRQKLGADFVAKFEQAARDGA